MTGRTHPTVPQDFSIQVAENEGMPSRSSSRDAPQPPARARRLSGTLTLGLSKTHAAAEGLRPASEEKSHLQKKTTRHPRARLVERMAALAGVIAFVAFPVLAQDGTGPTPENAESRDYGGGWDCRLGYRVNGEGCVAIHVPDNAYATGRSYGSGWACRRGYEEVGGVSCAAIPVPDNAFLRSSGFGWQCDRGYRKDRETCIQIVLPANVYLTEDNSGSGWTCERGFTARSGACVPIAIPENDYLTNADYGDAWAFERGFFEIDGRCDPMVLPASAFLDPTSYGPGWRCARGFEPVDTACAPIDLLANAHLDRTGNAWRCDRGFQLADMECVLGR